MLTLQAFSEDEGGAAALRASETTLGLLAGLLERGSRMAVRGRAAVLLAVLDAPSTHRHFSQVQLLAQAALALLLRTTAAICALTGIPHIVLQDVDALHDLLHLLWLCQSSGGDAFVEACWALICSAGQRLRVSTAPVPEEASTAPSYRVRMMQVRRSGVLCLHACPYLSRQDCTLLCPVERALQKNLTEHVSHRNRWCGSSWRWLLCWQKQPGVLVRSCYRIPRGAGW
jgi:hypothetical protein